MTNFSNFSNEYINNTDDSDQSTSLNLYIEQFYKFSKWTNVILMTVIGLMGIYGNTMSILIFSSKTYNKNSIKSLRIYLILLSTSDLCVIFFHYIDFTFRSWINLTGSYTSKFNFVDKILIFCKLIPYFRNVFRTISVYTLVLMTLQRLILLHFSSLRLKWSSIRFNKNIIIGLIVISLIINISTLVINDLIEHPFNQELFCSIKKDYYDLQFKIDILFGLLTILLPCVFILFLCIFLFLNVKKNMAKKSRIAKTHSLDTSTALINKEAIREGAKYKNYFNYLNTRYPQMPNLENIQTIQIKDLNKVERVLSLDGREISKTTDTNGDDNVDQVKKALNRSIRTTYMLVIVSKWFILLHLPYFISWLLFYLNFNNKMLQNLDDLNYRVLLRAFLNLFEILFLLNYTINFIIYFVNGPFFRKRHSKKIFKLIQNLVYVFSRCFRCF